MWPGGNPGQYGRQQTPYTNTSTDAYTALDASGSTGLVTATRVGQWLVPVQQQQQQPQQPQPQLIAPLVSVVGGRQYIPAGATLVTGTATALPGRRGGQPSEQQYQSQQQPVGYATATIPVGWGGQSLPPGGRGSSAARGGRGGPGRAGFGRGRGRRWGAGGAGRGQGTEQSDAVIAAIIGSVRQMSPGSSVWEVAAAAGLGQLDSRSAAVLMKQLASQNLNKQAWELFNWLRRLEESHPLKQLCDVYLYTAQISLCTNSSSLNTALELSREMQNRGIERNVHTFSALMNCCIKCGEHRLALDVYREMQLAGCQPNLVTFNTLIDLYGKVSVHITSICVRMD